MNNEIYNDLVSPYAPKWLKRFRAVCYYAITDYYVLSDDPDEMRVDPDDYDDDVRLTYVVLCKDIAGATQRFTMYIGKHHADAPDIDDPVYVMEQVAPPPPPPLPLPPPPPPPLIVID